MTPLGRRGWLMAVVALALAAGSAAPPSGQTSTGFAAPDAIPAGVDPVPSPTDRVATLARALADGTRSLSRDPQTGYLRSLLDALDVPAASQLLVFSKTGIQRSYTSPLTPRALYFNDSVAVGYLPGAPTLEIAAHDPQRGVVFYTLDQAGAAASVVPGSGCLTCHVSSSTLDVPGMIARSHVVDATGAVVPGEPSVAVTHATPHTARWGGWFVTANATAPPYSQGAHRGNVAATLLPDAGPAIESNHVFVAWLNSAPESRGYLASASDLAALLAFDHQMHALNLMTRLSREASAGVADARLDAQVRELADYLLFVGEASLAAPITPRPEFAAALAAHVPKDRRGRSLGQLDLATRLLRYPCSYMIYAPAFDGLAPDIKDRVYRRLFVILSGKAKEPKYAFLRPSLRRAIVEILRDTKHDLPTGHRG